MALSNPFKAGTQIPSFSTFPVQNNPLMQLTNQQLINQKQTPTIKFDEDKFKSLLPKMTELQLQNIVAQARLQGISEKEIEEGLLLIQNLKNKNGGNL